MRENRSFPKASIAQDMRRFGRVDSALMARRSRFADSCRPRAFTLIEMLVVIGLIGMLTGILAAVLVYARRVSVQVECKAHLAEIGKTIHAMALNDGGVYPALIDDDGLPWWANVLQEWDSESTLGKPGQLSSTMKALHCRAAGVLANFEQTASGTATDGGDRWLSSGGLVAGEHIDSWLRITNSRTPREIRRITGNDGVNLYFNRSFPKDPEAGSQYVIVSYENVFNSISYGLNFDVKDADGGDYECVPEGDPTYPELVVGPIGAADKDPDEYAHTEIARPSEFILISEADTQDPDPANWTGSRISMGAITRDGGDDPPDNAPIVGRHRGHANVLFADLRVEAVEVRDGSDWTRNVNDNTSLWTLPDD